MNDTEALARKMFDAYNAQAGGKTWDGKDIPPFGDVGPKVQANWFAAAQVALDAPRPYVDVVPVEEHEGHSDILVRVLRERTAREVTTALDRPDPMPDAQHTDATVRVARALLTVERHESPDVPEWDDLVVRQRRVMLAHAAEFLASGDRTARLVLALLNG